MKIVLAIDGSEYSKVAVDELMQMPFAPDTEVRIVSVFENVLLGAPGPVPMGGLPSDYKKAILAAKKSAKDTVEHAAQLLKEKNTQLVVTTAVLNGLPKHAILEDAEAFNADLIVVGSQGHGAVSRFLLGSVSQSLSMHADCSIMIVRKRSAKLK
ncbi:universal stress protein [Maribacter polysaccharolyticus]|uniref:universal stress protein n=1 Tax=Maribacter polysaccharolyticus TaxID=3020831 RepID=UPI00237FAB70|nr:universal stress protein [Maribacter polysaccharolyticus]MDE3741094.1 universal stress protein [Maribacter polysaccharolyticus]